MREQRTKAQVQKNKQTNKKTKKKTTKQNNNNKKQKLQDNTHPLSPPPTPCYKSTTPTYPIPPSFVIKIQWT